MGQRQSYTCQAVLICSARFAMVQLRAWMYCIIFRLDRLEFFFPPPLLLFLLPLVGLYRFIDVPLFYSVIYVARVGASFYVAVVYALTSFCLAGKCCGRASPTRVGISMSSSCSATCLQLFFILRRALLGTILKMCPCRYNNFSVNGIPRSWVTDNCSLCVFRVDFWGLGLRLRRNFPYTIFRMVDALLVFSSEFIFVQCC